MAVVILVAVPYRAMPQIDGDDAEALASGQLKASEMRANAAQLSPPGNRPCPRYPFPASSFPVRPSC